MRSKFRFMVSSPAAQLNSDTTISFFASGNSPSADPNQIGKMLDRTSVEFTLSTEGAKEESQISGSLFITVPGAPEESHPLAALLAHDYSEHVSFFYPGFRILGGLISAERLPDNEEEAALVASGPFWATVSLEEVLPPFPLDPEVLRLFPYSRDLLVPIAQVNAATRSTNPIDGYLSAIKALEYLYHRSRSGSFAASLQASSELRAAVSAGVIIPTQGGESRAMTEAEVNQFLAELADTRNKCAHLRDQGNYGYGQRNPEIFTVVKPRLELLIEIIHHILSTRMTAARTLFQASREKKEVSDT